MAKSPIHVVGMALFAVLLGACSTSRLEDEPIPRTVEDIAPTLSRIATPVLVPIGDLRALVDRRLSGELYSESLQITTGGTFDVVLNRRDAPVTMEMVGNLLTTGIPLNANGRLTVAVGPFSIARSEAINADLDVRLSTSVRLDSDWSVVSDSTVDIDVEQAEITVPGMNLNVSTIIEEILQRNSERVAGPVDNYLADLDIRAMLEPVWQSLARPIRITEVPSVWLRLEPVAFGLSPPESSRGDLRFDIDIELYIDSVVGERPGAVALGPIPPLGESPDSAGIFEVTLPIIVELDQATEAVSDQLVGREDQIGTGARVRWLSVELSGAGDRLTAAVGFEAETGWWFFSRLSGEMAIEGRPSFNPETQTLTMTGVDYELESDSRLAEIADWLVHERLRNRIEEELIFPLGAAIEDLRASLQTELGNASLGSYGTMEAEIDTLTPVSVRVNDSVVELLMRAEGAMGIDLILPVR